MHHRALGKGLAGGRIVARHQGQQRGVARFVRELHVPDLQARVGRLDALDQRARRQHRPLACGVVERRVQPFVQLVVEGQHAAGEAGEKQEQRGRKADVAVQQHEDRAHRQSPFAENTKPPARWEPAAAGGAQKS
ncbi:hypothetical protein D3C77_486300 [compost metagenome]